MLHGKTLCAVPGGHTVALASDVFTVLVGGDAYTLNEQAARGEKPALCPALNSFCWAVESSEVVADKAKVLAASLKSNGGLSFTTARFSGGLALLRSALPGMDVFTTRTALRRTCLPLPAGLPRSLGVGRHCFVLAFLCLEGLRTGIAKPTPPHPMESLTAPSGRKRGDADAALCEMLQWVAASLIQQRKWGEAAAAAQSIVDAIKPWASPWDLALANHVLGSCLEAIGHDEQAIAPYQELPS